MTVVVVATIRPLPDHRAEVIAAMDAIAAQVHAEDGCLLYALHEGPDRLVLIEKWSSRDALDRHLAAPQLAAFIQKVNEMSAAPSDMQVLQPHPAGAPDQGAL